MALEPRVMYDGAAAATAATAAQQHADAAASGASGSSAATTTSGAAAAPPPADHPADQPAPVSNADNSHSGTPADSSPAGTPAAPAETPSNGGHQIVFIDGNVPDAQVLAHGVQAGIEVVILDPDSNGVQQIADYLTSHNEHDLAAIQIVSHGEEATVRLGNTILGLANISMFKDQLATIGQALRPGGDILFYGCNVGEGFAGALFEVQLSIATGGASVAASSGLVGNAALGGSWTLDVADGVIDVGNPFTAATLADYDDVLTNQIWFTQTGTIGNVKVMHGDANGSGAVTNVTQVSPADTGFNFKGIALDAADGFYFVVDQASDKIYRGSISGGALTSIYTSVDTNGNGFNFLSDITYSPVTNKLYFAQADNDVGFDDVTDSAIYSMNIDGSGATKIVSPTATGLRNPQDIAIDTTNNLIFFTDFGDTQGSATVARVQVASLLTGAILNNSLASIDSNNPTNANRYFYGIDVDPVNSKIYWTMADPNNAGGNQLFSATYLTNGSGLSSGPTAFFTSTDTQGLPTSITVDVANGVYYASYQKTASGTSGTIIEGKLDGSTGANSKNIVYTFAAGLQPGFVMFEGAPIVTAGTSVSYTEQQASPVALASSLTITDTDSKIASATVSLGASFFAGDRLNFTDQNGITGSYNTSTGILSLSGVATAANYQTALRSITYSSISDNPTNFGASTTRTISWTASDGLVSNTAVTSTVSITGVNDAPTVTAGTTVSYTEQGTAATLASTLTVSDADNLNLAGATITISAGFVAGDTLNFSTQNGITGSYNSGTGVLTLSGSATLSNYQTALRSITFSSSSDNPTNLGGTTSASRTIGWVVTDGALSSTVANSTVNVTAVNDAPVVTAGTTVSFTEQGSAVVLASTLTVSDADNQSLASATVSISAGRVTGDTLNFTNTATITGSYNSGTGVLTLSGSDTVANYQAALRSITFSSNSDNPTNIGGTVSTSRTISWTANDGTASSSVATSTVNVTAVNDAPVVVAGTTVTYTEQQASPVVLASTLTVSDADNAGLTSATVTISTGRVTGDTLAFNSGASSMTFGGTRTINASYNSGTGVLTLTAGTGSPTVADFQAALRTVTFSSTSDDPTAILSGTPVTSRTISWQTTDGTTPSTAVTSTVTVTPVNDAPVVTAGTTVGFTEQGSAVTLASTLTVTDADSPTLASATVSISSGFFAGDTLNFTDQNGITGSYNSGTGVLTLTGSASATNYRDALRSITFSSASDNPTNFGASTSRTISWTASDGTATSTAATSTLNITAVNDVAVVTAGATANYSALAPGVVLDAGLTVSDADNQNLASAKVTISAGRVTGDSLNFTNQNGISGSYNSSTGVLTLTGSSSVANYQTALESITFSSSNADPTNGGASGSRTISWTVNDGTADSAAATSSVNVGAPVLVAGATVSFTEQGAAVVLDSGLALSDSDSPNLASATVSIGGFVAGDTLNFTNQNGISGSYDSGTGVLTLTGSASVANYQAALASVTFSSASDNATNFGANTSRTITWVANDGILDSTPATSTVNITAVNDAPTVTAGTTIGYTEQGTAAVLASSLTVSDADNQTLASASVSITSGFLTGDTLNFTTQNGISGSYDGGTGVLTLTGSSSVANYQTALRSITFSSSSDNPTNFGANASRTIGWQVNDGTVDSTAATSTVNVTAVNDAPVVTAGTTVGFTEQGSVVVLASTLTISDADNQSLTGATVSLGATFFAGDTLNFTDQNGITGSYNSGTGVLSLTGSASVANYQAALRSVTFSSASDNPANYGASPTRTVSWTATDGTTTSTAATSTVNITAVNDAPTVTAGTTVGFTEQGSAVVLASSLTLNDVDNLNLASATVSIGGFFAGDTLNFTDQNGITGSYDTGTGVLNLSGSATLANYQAALRSITFSSASDNPTNFAADTSRTISWTVNDGTVDSAAATSTVNVTAVNDAPVVTAGTTVGYTEQGSAAALASSLTVSDADNQTLASASVSITSGFLTGDSLNFTDQNGISGSYDSGTGVLTLTGSTTLANYQAALRSITFSSTSDNPTNLGGTVSASRTVSWQVNDGTADSTAATSTVNVTAVNDAPVVTAGTTVGFTEQGSAVILASSLTVTDADNTTLASATVSIGGFVAGDTLNFTDQNDISGSYDSGTGVLTLTGGDTVAHYQAALRSITFSSASDNPTNFGASTSRTISWTVSDGSAASTAATSTLNVTAVNDAPVVTAGATVSYTEQGTAAVLDSALTLSDVDNQNLASATVSIGTGFVAGDTLNFTDQNGISGSYDSGTGVLTLSGSATLANYQAALRSITFTSSSDNPTNLGGTVSSSRTISWQVNDGTVDSTAATSTVNVTAVNDAPVVTAGTTVSFTEQGSAVVLASTLTVSDADNTTLASASVSITSGFLAGDALSFTDQNGISGSYDSGTGVLTLTGSASVANYQAALRSITFSAAGDNPTSFGTDNSRTITWQVNDGALNSTSATSTVNVTAVNDAPVVTAGTTVGFTEQGSAVTLASTLTVSDVDNQNLASATVSIGGFVAGDTLNFTDQNGITGSYDSGTGVLTLTGSASVTNYRDALRSITFSSASDNPANFGASTSRTVSWQVNDGTVDSTAATSTINVTAVNDAPVVTAGTTVGFTEQGSAVVLASSLTVSDADNQSLASATVSISAGLLGGDSLNFTDQNGITGSYDSGTGVLSLTGTSSVANYQAALRSITFSSASDNPTSFGADNSRTVTWQVNDGALNSTSATSTVNVTAVNDAPVVTAGTTVGFTEQGSAVTLASTLTISDADNTTLASASVSIGGFVAGDTLNFTDQNGITGSYDSGTGVLTLAGSATVANYRAALRSITFSSASDNPTSFGTDTSRTVSWQVNDGTTASTAATSTINITAVNDAPVVTAGTTVGFTEQGTAAVLASTLTVSDVDNTTLAGATVSISTGLVAGDTLNFTDQNGITGSYDSGTGVLSLTGSATLAGYQAALRSITFSSASDNPTSLGTDTSRTISWQVNDGAADSTTAISTLNITAVNDAPVVTAGTTVGFTEQGSAVVLASTLTVSDADNTDLASATVSIGGFVAGDTLNFTDQNGITGSYDSGTGVLSLTGSASVANYQAALRSITFSSGSDNPTSFGASTSRTVSWQVVDGTATSTAATSIVNITPVDDAPVVTAGAIVSYTEQGSAVALDSGLTLSDVDNTTLTGATVSISSGLFAGDTLNFTNQNGITGSYDSGTGVLTLTGTDTLAHYQAALRSITFSSTSDNPTSFGANTSRAVTWQVNDGALSSTAATSTVVVTAVNDAPVVLTGGTAGFFQPSSPVTLDATATVRDADNETLAGATVSITSGLLTGDTLAASTTGTAITASYNAATGVLTLSGADTIAHYNQVLQNVTFGSSASDPTNGGAATTRTFSWQTNDGSAANNLSNVDTTSLEAHVRPVVTASGTVTFTASTPVAVDPAVTAVDADVNPIVSARVTIVGGMASGDTLALGTTTVGGVTFAGSFDAGTGTLTITASAGSPTAADFQSALRSVTFSNASASGMTRTISWTLDTSDSRQTSVASFSSISPAPPPTDTGPTVGAPPVAPPPGLFPPAPPMGFTPTGLLPGPTFSFTIPPSFFESGFLGSPSWISAIFTSGPGGMPNFFDFSFGGFHFTIGPYGTISVTDAQPSAFETPPRAVADAAGAPPAEIAKPPGDAPGNAPAKVAPAPAAIDLAPAPETADATIDREPAALGRTLLPPAIALDVDRLGEAGSLLAAGLAGAMDMPAAPETAPTGKLGLSAQLRAAGRQGLLHDRQALLNSLHNGLGG